MAKDSAYQPIFKAFSDLLKRDTRWLVIQVGNHDIELALPAAQQALRDLLCAGDVARAKRLVFETTGRGWSCKVGPRLVLAVHGNAADPWNVVDHAGLEAAGLALLAGRRPVPMPAPNAGTTMVLNVINDVKQRYPFVDLLKPEDAPLMAVLAAVDADTSTRGLLKALRRRVVRGQFSELLGAEPESSAGIVPGVEGEIMKFLEGLEAPRPVARETVLRAERHLNSRVTVRSLVQNDQDQLGGLVARGHVALQQLEGAIGRLRREPELAALRRALVRWLGRDDSFAMGRLSAIDLRILDSAPGGVDVVLAGHTHLAREQFGDPVYINTGTWMRVLSLGGTPYLESDEQFRTFLNAVQAGTLQALDALDIDQRLRPVALIDAGSARLHFVEETAPDQFELKPPSRGMA